MIEHFIHSESGHQPINEDAVEVRRHPLNEQIWLGSLADGQGGRSGGAIAAQQAVQESLRAALALQPLQLQTRYYWHCLFKTVDLAVQKHPDAGFSTLVTFGIANQSVSGVSCGDSAALLLTQGQPCLLTENQMKNPPIGSGSAIPTFFSAELSPPWKLLVMSDGVWKFIGWENLTTLVSTQSGHELIQSLQASALQSTNVLADDFSLVLFQELE